MYKEIIDELGFKHQLCIWYFKKDLKKAIKKIKKENKLSFNELELIDSYIDEIFQLFILKIFLLIIIKNIKFLLKIMFRNITMTCAMFINIISICNTVFTINTIKIL